VLHAEDIPATFPVREANETLDYDNVKISDQQFMVPLKATVFMSDGKTRSKNDKEFRNYQKYSADAKVTFDVPDALPEDQTKEQAPPQGQPPKP
jgi:hypothetical protein